MKKKEKIRVKGRAAAIISMVLLIVISVPLGMGFSLVRERNKVTEHYFGSNDTYGLLEDLSGCTTEASNLVTLSGKYLGADDAKLTEVRSAAGRLETAQSPSEKAGAYSTLTISFNSLYNELCGMELSEQDSEYLEAIYSDYYMYVDLVSYSDYNIKVANFNETFRNAPGRRLAELMGVKELEPFA